jgi:hypothetical protein
MAICQCLKADGKPCSREGSTKTGHNSIFCWQHQVCKTPAGQVNKAKQISQTTQKVQKVQKIQKAEPVAKKQLPHFNDKYVEGLSPNVVKQLIQMATGCPRNKFISPKTGKCVAISSPTGQIIVKELMY